MSVSVPSAKSAEITVPTEMDDTWTVKVIAPDGSETAIKILDQQVRYFKPKHDSDPVTTALWLAYADRWWTSSE